MTPRPKLPKLENIDRIVINKISVWDLTPGDWHKTKGGPGFQIESHNHSKNAQQMKSFIYKKLSITRRTKVFENRDLTLFEEDTAYRWWISGNSLNIVRKDLI
jgi:hypothetical protein